MIIPKEFEIKFKKDIEGKTPDEILAIMEKYLLVDYNGKQRYVVRKEFERLVAEKGVCNECKHKKVRHGIYPALADKFPLEIRQIRNIVTGQ